MHPDLRGEMNDVVEFSTRKCASGIRLISDIASVHDHPTSAKAFERGDPSFVQHD
ncbi:MAG: hypothetical protein KKB78_08290 [Alphaproteobacteria bacterium]|nr:hypothetical protein [Alphaproteobacteria bacterium]MBU0864442.1 hypothetical protein [Alphaproteobacteria bacterium]